MNTSVVTHTFKPRRFGIAGLFTALLAGLMVLLFLGLMIMADKPSQTSPVEPSPPHINNAHTAIQTVSASDVLGHDQPTLILFYPVEVCRQRYCLTPEAIEAGLSAIDPRAMNLMSVAVYAVSIEENQIHPALPLLDWDVYAVEPYLSWLPEFSQTVYGWGLEAPEVVLVDSDGTVLYRGDEYFAPEELKSYVEPSAPSATAATVDSQQK